MIIAARLDFTPTDAAGSEYRMWLAYALIKRMGLSKPKAAHARRGNNMHNGLTAREVGIADASAFAARCLDEGPQAVAKWDAAVADERAILALAEDCFADLVAEYDDPPDIDRAEYCAGFIAGARFSVS